MTLTLAVGVYTIAAITSWFASAFLATVLDPSPVNDAEAAGNRVIAGFSGAIAVFAAASLGVALVGARHVRARRLDHRRKWATFGTTILLILVLAQAIMWMLGAPRWVGALVSDDPSGRTTYGARGWLMIAALLATMPCVELLRRAISGRGPRKTPARQAQSD